MKQMEEQPFELEKGKSIINNKYRVLGKVGSGAHSSIHAVLMVKAQKQYVRAIKVESTKIKEAQISTEVSVLKNIHQSYPEETGFAKLYEYGNEEQYHYVVMTLLGPNLEQLLKLCGGTFSMKTTLMLGLQILDRLQILHNLGYIYSDVKPDNFLVGLGNESPYLFMVDFGRCKRYRNKINGQHILYKQNASYTYNPIFGSINSHNNIQASRRDDMESFLYVLTYLKLGKLPWAKTTDTKRNKTQLNIGEVKKRVTPEMLCHKLPIQIIDLVYYVRSLQFYQKPDYNYIRKMLYTCLQREQLDSTIMYDWNKLEEIDFKVYSDQPKINLKAQHLPSQENLMENRQSYSTEKQSQNQTSQLFQK